MQLAYVIVYVADVPASLSFFEAAFGLSRGFVSPGGEFGTLATGATALAFCQHALARDSVGRPYRSADGDDAPLGMEVALSTPDVPAACTRAVAAGARLLVAPAAKPWGQTVAYVQCPDGTLVELCTPMG